MLIFDPWDGLQQQLHNEETNQRYVLAHHLRMIADLLSGVGSSAPVRPRVAAGLTEIARQIEEYLDRQRTDVPGTWATDPSVIDEVTRCIDAARTVARAHTVDGSSVHMCNLTSRLESLIGGAEPPPTEP